MAMVNATRIKYAAEAALARSPKIQLKNTVPMPPKIAVRRQCRSSFPCGADRNPERINSPEPAVSRKNIESSGAAMI